MDKIILLNMLVLGGTAFVAAVVLYFVSQKFKTKKDKLTDEITAVLPQANCGGCGRAGCADFAQACARADQEEFGSLFCPVGGTKVMEKIASLKGVKTIQKAQTAAVLLCQGDCKNAPAKFLYDHVFSCQMANRLAAAQSGCPNGCLHLGDCVKVCKFGALSLNNETGMPEVDWKKCTSCGACVKTCPRGLFEIRPFSAKNKMVYVACRNQQKGAAARKNCAKACIGCGKCAKINEAIVLENNLSYIPAEIDAETYGAELAQNCPTGAIIYKEKTHD